MANSTVKVTFLGDSSDLKKSIDDVDGKASSLNKAAGAAAIGVGALGVALFASGKAFAEDEKAAASLAKTLENTTGATKEQIAGVEKFISKTQNASGVLDDELRPALDTLVRGTGDVTKAQKLLGLAMDISAGTGKDLGSVTEALSKASNGNFTALKKLNPALADLIKDGASTDEVMGALAKTFEGQTAVAADTTAGKIAIAKARFSDLQEEIGAKVVPVMAALAEFISTKLIPAIESIVGWLEEHRGVAIALAAVIGGALVAAFIAWAVAAASAAAATIAATWPILAIIAAIAALAAGVIYAYTHWGWFKTAVDAVADAMVWLWNNVLKPIGAWIWDKLIPTIAELTVKFWTFLMDVKDVASSVIGAFVDIANAIMAPFKTAFDWIRNAWDSSVGAIFDKISSVGGFVGGALGKIPGFATGGIVPGPVGAPQLAVVHGGEQVLTPGQQRMGGGDIVINIGGHEFARIAANELRRQNAGSR